MAKTIEHMDFYVAIAPYKTDEHGEQEFNTLSVSVSYKKGRGFLANYHPGWKSSLGYGCVFDFSKNPLTSTTWVDIEPTATKNNVKKLEQYKVNLEMAKDGIALYFDHRLWPQLNAFVKNVANYGYTPFYQDEIAHMKMLAEKKAQQETIDNNSNDNNSNEQVMETKNNNNESANVQNNAQVSNPESEVPMTKQYKQMKEKNPNAILLFRHGDFYETYFEDAAAAAEVLGITLTKKGDMPLAGFPHHALEQYLPKLVRAGKRVAICDANDNANPNANDNANDNDNDDDKDKAVTVPLGEHGTLIIGKPGLTPSNSPRGEQEPDNANDNVNDNANDNANANAEEEIVDVSTPLPTGEGQGERLCSVEFSTYTTKKGNTAPQIIGFGGEDDPRWQSHKDAGHKYVSASWKKDLNGEKVYILMFGTRYMDVAKALAGAYNTNDREAWKRAEDACMAIYEQAQRDGKARWEAKKAEWAKKSAERKAKKEAEKKCYTKEDVAAMLNDLLAGKDIPEDIKRLLPKAA